MKFYSFGSQEKPVILLLPGTCCHWKLTFGQVIPLLEPDFRVVCVSYDGFDDTEDTIFPDMLTETEKIEAYIKVGLNKQKTADTKWRQRFSFPLKSAKNTGFWR